MSAMHRPHCRAAGTDWDVVKATASDKFVLVTMICRRCGVEAGGTAKMRNLDTVPQWWKESAV